MMIDIGYDDDVYDSGSKVGIRVFRDKMTDPGFVSWNLPSGERLFTSLAEFNKSFPVVFNNDKQEWKNKRNKVSREKLGIE